MFMVATPPLIIYRSYFFWNKKEAVIMVVLFMVFGLTNLWANTNPAHITPDSFTVNLERQLKTAKELRNVDIRRSLSITQKLLKDSLNFPNDSLLYEVKYYHSYYLMMNDNNIENQALIESISPYFKKNNLRRWTILKVRMASAWIRFGEYDKAVKALNEALPYTKELAMTISEGLIYIHLCDIHQLKSDFVSAYKSADLALQLFKEKNREDWVADVLTTLGHICTQIKDYDCAASYFEQVLTDTNTIQSTRFMVRPLLYSGIMHFETGNYQQAKVNFENGLEKIHLVGNFPDISLVYQYLSKISIREKEYLQAKDYIQTALKYAKTSKNKRYSLSNQLVLVQIESVLQPEKDNLLLVEQVYQWSLQNEDYPLLKESSNFLSKYYIEKGNFKEALVYKDVYLEASEKKMARDKVNEIGLIKEKNKFEKEAKEREILEKELKYKLQSNKEINRIMLFSILVLFLMSGFLYYFYRERTMANKSLKITNSELKKTENILAQKNQELKRYIDSNIQLEQFAHIASHDLRAPLITINSFSKLLKTKVSKKLTDEEQKYIGFIQTSGSQMLDLVNDLLEYSKVNSQKINPVLINTRSLVENVVDMTKNLALEKQVELKIMEDLPLIYADEIKIKRVFQNLISNAIKFSDTQKKPQVKIYFDEHPTHWTFHVADNGIGIKDSSIDIFQPYVQLNRKADYKGTGLGLSICEKIIQQHGGEISYRSEFGKGTTFTFDINKNLN